MTIKVGDTVLVSDEAWFKAYRGKEKKVIDIDGDSDLWLEGTGTLPQGVCIRPSHVSLVVDAQASACVFKFGDKVWNTRVNGWVLVISVDPNFQTIGVRSFDNQSSLHDFTYTLDGKDSHGVQRLFHEEQPIEQPKPRFAPGTPLVAVDEDGDIFAFIAGEEGTFGIYDAKRVGLFPYTTYKFFVVGDVYESIS